MRRYKIVGVLGAISCAILTFQNCGGELAPLSSAVELQNLYDSQSIIDSSLLPNLLSADSISYWEKNSVISFEKTPLFAEASSVILALDSTQTGNIYSLNSGTNLEDAQITFNNGVVRASHVTDLSNYSYLEASVPVNPAGKFLIAAAFGNGAKEITLLINGLNQQATVNTVGTPLAYSYLSKNRVLPTNKQGLFELAIYDKALSGSELNVLSRYIAKSAQVSSVAFDPSLVDTGGGSGVASPTLGFLAAKSVIDRNCLECHGSGSPNGTFADLSQDQFIRKGLISPKNLAGSKMYSRLTGVSVGPGPGNMPLGKAALSDPDKTVIATWINSIQ